jgi:hypothetical protein
MLFPVLNPMDPSIGQPLGTMPTAMEPLNLTFLSGMTDTAMEDAPTTAPKMMDPCAGGAPPLPPRAIDPGFMPNMMYMQNFAHHPMGSMPYPGSGPTGVFATTNGHSPQLANHTYGKIESISDLVSPASLDFKYSPELNAILHAGKCLDCICFGLHIIMPGNCTKFLCAMSAHSDTVTGPLRAEVDKLTQDALIASKNLKELKDALQLSQKLMASLKSE